MEIEPILRVENLSKFKFVDEPYVQMRKYVLENLKHPIAPFWYQGKLYTSIDDIAEKIDVPITFYNQNVGKVAEEVDKLIKDSGILFTVNYCTGEKKEPNIYQARRILQEAIWFRVLISVEFSQMFIIEDPYFPNASAGFNFGSLKLNGLTYLGKVFQVIQYLHDLYNPTLECEWEARMEAMKKLIPGGGGKPQDMIKGMASKAIGSALLGKNWLAVNDRTVISDVDQRLIEENLSKMYPNDFITAIRNEGRVVGDIQIVHTLYKIGQRDVFRVFNCTEFELVGYEEIGGLRVASRVVRARCELIVASLFILLGNKKAEQVAEFLMTKKYALGGLELKNLTSPQYAGSVFPYEQYLKKRSLETIRARIAN